MKKPIKLAVSERALAQRINRKLKPDMEGLRKSRTVRSVLDVGEWYVVDFSRNLVVQKDVDLEILAKELGVLKEWETVA